MSFCLFTYVIQHCFICHPSDYTVSEDAGIEPMTVVTLALTAMHTLNQTARSHLKAARSHLQTARSHSQTARSHPHAARSYSWFGYTYSMGFSQGKGRGWEGGGGKEDGNLRVRK